MYCSVGKISVIYVFLILIENHFGKVLQNLNLQLKINDRLFLDNITNCILSENKINVISKKKTI